MTETDESRGDPDIDELVRLVIQVNTLARRYRHREETGSEPEIAGGSRSLLVNLYRSALRWLPRGPVADSVTELLAGRDVQELPISMEDGEPDRLMVSNELDLLEGVVQELQGVAERLLNQAHPGQASAGQLRDRYSSRQFGGEQPGPSTLRNRRMSVPRSSLGQAEIPGLQDISVY